MTAEQLRASTIPSSSQNPAIDFSAVEVTDDISDIKWLDGPVFLVFWILMFVVALQFFTRYVLGDSLGWTEEIARFFLIFLGFIGSVTCVRKESHIFLEFFYRFLPSGTIKSLAMFVDSICALFYAALGYLAIELAKRTSEQKMVSIDVSKAVIYWIVVGACFAMAAVAVVNIVKLMPRSKEDVAAEKLNQAASSI